MFVSAFTNAVGNHTLHDWRVERTDGMVWDVNSGTVVPYHNVDASYSIPVAHSRKPPHFHGDKRTAYDYWRGVQSVVDDTPYILRFHWHNPSGSYVSYYDTQANEYISKRHGPFNYDPVYVSDGHRIENGMSEAITKALLSLRGKYSSDLASSIGELQPTVESLAKTVTRGGNFIRHMRRGRWREAAYDLGISPKAFNNNRGRALADYWLSYSYGWKPLAQTMYDLSDTVCEHVNRISNYVEGNGTVILNGDDEFPYNNWEVIGSWAARIKVVLKATMTNPQLVLISETGLTNPVSVAWELVPFSFVVDWFVPVGNTLSALSAPFGLSWHGGYISKTIHKAVSIRHKTGYITPWVDCLHPGSYKERMSEFQRIALTGFPYPQFYADESPFSSPRVANALALVRTLT
jgi:hypothetical protein